MSAHKTNNPESFDFSSTPPTRIQGRGLPWDEPEPGRGEANALLARLSREVAALRAALDVSRHKIAQLEVEAAQDPVSGLLNQRAFLREIGKAVEFHGRYRADASVVLLSAEGMTGVAERHGHRVVQRVLRTMGDRLRATIRSCDVAARIEPYQFGVLLWNTSGADCVKRLDMMRAALGGMDRLLEGRVAAVQIRAAATPITADDSADQIFQRAEARLADLPGRPVRR
jgi:diguanylate cyclase (GGDEF)-like protein